MVAAVGIPLAVFIIYWGVWPVGVLMAAAGVLGAREYYHLKPDDTVAFGGLGAGRGSWCIGYSDVGISKHRSAPRGRPRSMTMATVLHNRRSDPMNIFHMCPLGRRIRCTWSR